MRFGVILPQYGRFASGEAMVRMAQAAEDLGWDTAWGSDHTIVPHPYLERFSEMFYEIFTSLAYVAARTKRIRLGTSVLLLPYRHPVSLAKQVASLDQLSGGRTIIGIAAGWMQEEFEVLDLPFRERGRRHDEAARALIHIWTSDSPVFQGEYYRFSGFAFSPRPLQRPYPPLWIGGNDRRALRRVVEFGTGWHPITSLRIGLSLEELGERIRELRAMAEEGGRRFEEITVSLRAPLAFGGDPGRLSNLLTFIGSSDEITRRLEICTKLGVHSVEFDCFYSMPDLMQQGAVDEFIKTMERFAREVQPRFAQ